MLSSIPAEQNTNPATNAVPATDPTTAPAIVPPETDDLDWFFPLSLLPVSDEDEDVDVDGGVVLELELELEEKDVDGFELGVATIVL